MVIQWQQYKYKVQMKRPDAGIDHLTVAVLRGRLDFDLWTVLDLSSNFCICLIFATISAVRMYGSATHQSEDTQASHQQVQEYQLRNHISYSRHPYERQV
jgi:hypothetical protein